MATLTLHYKIVQILSARKKSFLWFLIIQLGSLLLLMILVS